MQKKHYTFHFFTTFAIYFNINIRELEKLVHQHPLTVIYYYVKNSCVLTLIALKIGICEFLQAMRSYTELADGSLLTVRHIQVLMHSATARHEHEAKRNANASRR